jgi:SNF2 family DNA or RNA helicase
MLVHKATRKLVFNLKDPSRVTTVIPTAKTFEYKGTTLLAVPHNPDEVKVLRNLGFDVPSPILHYYNWPLSNPALKPFHAQLLTSAFLTSNQRAFCLNDMGTGKTLATLWAYDFLRRNGFAKKAVVITPLSTLERTWGDEIWRNFPRMSFSVLHGTRERRLKLLDQDADIYLINHDGLKVSGLLEALNARKDITHIIIDEVAAFRNHSTARWKALNKLCNADPTRWVWGLTGTPIPNEPTDAWAQCRLIVPHTVPAYFGRFRDTVMKQISQFKWVARPTALDHVSAVMQPSIRFKRDECVDLPEVLYQERYAEMSPAQVKAYKLMASKLAFEVGSDQVLAVNEAVKTSKLVQIACGAAYADDGVIVQLDCSSRTEVVKEIIEQAGAKVIVFVPFTGALEHVAETIAKWLNPVGWVADTLSGTREYGAVGIVNGATKKADRDVLFSRFQKDPSLRVLVAQPATMSHGLTLTAANTIVWYAPPTSNEIFEQANARVSRPGQKLKQFIVMIEGSDIERKMYHRLQNKQKTQGLLLEIVKEFNG